MNDRIDLGRLGFALRAVGLVIWAFVGTERMLGVELERSDGHGWWIAWLVYGVAFVASAPRHVPEIFAGALLAVQTVAALAMPWLGCPHSEGLMLAVVSAEAAVIVSLRRAMIFAAVQLVLLVIDVAPTHDPNGVIHIGGAYSVFAAFALITTWLFRRESRARTDLARVHAALVDAQGRLAESSRAGERLRIARELHDTMGHHLAAMSIQLDLASRTANGPGADALKASHALSRKLLGEVRSVVTAIRDDAPVDLGVALASLGEGVAKPEVHCTVAKDLPAQPPAAAHALYRCAQEAVTNALRHAEASNVWIELAAERDQLVLAVRDDGHGASRVDPGAGLRGMRERFEQLGGSVAFANAASGGFEVRATLPIQGGAS